MVAARSEPSLFEAKEAGGYLTGRVNEPLSLAEARSLVERMATSEAWQRMDEIDRRMESDPSSFREIPTHHIFTPGLYVREVCMKAGEFLSTRIHLTEHPFIVSMGRFLLWTAEQGVIELGAPYTGITKPGTRRFLYILSDTIFSTIHANPDNETDPEKILDRITYNNQALRNKAAASL